MSERQFDRWRAGWWVLAIVVLGGLAGLLFIASPRPAVGDEKRAETPGAKPENKGGDVSKGDKPDPGDKPSDGDNGEGGKKEPKKRDLPQPRPEYKPEQVVQIVMDALQNNDADDSGIAVTFNFSSPDNRAVTGPLERFIPMVKNPVYGPMIRCKDVQYGEAIVKDDQAGLLVVVMDADGNKAHYLFRLSKQADGEFKGCWMTDAVVRVEPKGKQAAASGWVNGHADAWKLA